MKRLFYLIAATSFIGGSAFAQGAENIAKRPSPPAEARQTIKGGAELVFMYSQPSVKGRTIGKDLEPMEGKVWRAGANEATIFSTSKALRIEGKPLPQGMYAFFARKQGSNWTLIFNKKFDTWGAYDYEKNKRQDVLKVTVKEEKAPAFSEKLVYRISPEGLVSLTWGDKLVQFRAATEQ